MSLSTDTPSEPHTFTYTFVNTLTIMITFSVDVQDACLHKTRSHCRANCTCFDFNLFGSYRAELDLLRQWGVDAVVCLHG